MLLSGRGVGSALLCWGVWYRQAPSPSAALCAVVILHVCIALCSLLLTHHHSQLSLLSCQCSNQEGLPFKTS